MSGKRPPSSRVKGALAEFMWCQASKKLPNIDGNAGWWKFFQNCSTQYRHQEFQFLLLDTVHCGTESEHQVLNDSHIFVSSTGILLLFGTKFQYSCKRRQDEEGNNPIRLPLETWCSLSVPQCTASNKGN